MVRFPDKVETQRLLLRLPVARDARRFCKAVNESLPELRQWMPWAVEPYDIQKARSFCEVATKNAEDGDDYSVLIVTKSRRRIVGCCSIKARDWAVPRFEIGYWLRTGAVGNGYATEAARALTELAFRSLAAERVEIRVDDRNARSYAIPERLGFELEATLRAHERATNGELSNTRIYTMWSLSRLT
ncbi:MAG: GNAT family N-acetyltransferase [Gammaproteobacteria bacterium]|nr:GNAT family N-acetyltransferase [Gammaproteobacteria bacterium]